MESMRRFAVTVSACCFSAWSMLPALAATATSPPALFDHVTRHDFTRLSNAGSKAFDDVAMARLAIFDGHPLEATRLIATAQSAFEKAATDRTVFVEAEDQLAALHRPPAQAGAAAAAPIAWIPVAEGFVLNETLAPPPQGAAHTIETANASLRANRRQNAIETLRVAHISAVDTVALAPLDASLSAIHRASELMAASDYYGASQSLRTLEDGVRFDTVDAGGVPGGPASLTAAAAPSGDHIRP